RVQFAREKVPEGIQASGCEHVFSIRRTRDGGLMNINILRQLVQGQWPQGNITVLEKAVLAFENGLGNTNDGGVALLHVLYEPACFLQFTPQKVSAAIGSVAQIVHVSGLQAGARHGRVIEADAPSCVIPVNNDVRYGIGNGAV